MNFPYKREEVVFANVKAGNQLAGTLTMPTSGKVTKIVVLITGSGPQNRDEELAGVNHRPFLVWSDWLTRNGIAVLRYDDRGIGKSTGDFNTATTVDFASDVEAAVSYIESRADLKKLSIGLIGHSEGGLIAPMVSSHNKAVKFVVLLAGPGVPIAELMVQQNKDQLRLAGTSAANISLLLNANKKLFAMMNANEDLHVKELRIKLDTLLRREYSTLPKELLNGQTIDAVVSGTISHCTTVWYRYFISINPADALNKVKCPVLALNGTLDMQVSVTNLDAIKIALEKAGNAKITIMPLAGLNHLFQHAATGSVNEYSQNTETINAVALQKVSGWINEL